MAVIETWLEQDLQAPVKVRYLDGSLFSNNGNGNRIGVRVYNNGEPVTLSGTVSGYVVVADGSTVPCTGSRSENEASILIPPAAYQPGAVFISIFLTDGNTVTTLAAVASSVMQTRTNNQVSPGSVISDWTDTINAAMQAVEDASAAQDVKIADLRNGIDAILSGGFEEIDIGAPTSGNYIKRADGTVSSSSSAWKYTGFLPVKQGTVVFTCPRSTNTTQLSNVASVAFYSDSNVSSGSFKSAQPLQNGTIGTLGLVGVSVPSDANFCRFSIYGTSANDFKAFNVPNSFDELKDLKTILNMIVMTKGQYINLSGSSVTMSGGVPQFTGISSNGYDVGIMPCSAGDAFTINGHGGSSTRLWGFVNSSGTILSVSSANKTENGATIIAPTGAAWLIVHTNDGRVSYKGYDRSKEWQYNTVDILSYLPKTSQTKYGVTYTWTGDVCVVDGEATSPSWNNLQEYNNGANIPLIVPGERYYVKFKQGANGNVALGFGWHLSDSSIKYDLCYFNTEITAPSNYESVTIGLVVRKGMEADNETIEVNLFNLTGGVGVVEERVDLLESSLTDFLPRNILPDFGAFLSQTINNVSYTWQDKKTCIVNGTATGVSYNFLWMYTDGLPANIIPGKQYKVIYETSVESVVGVHFYYQANDAEETVTDERYFNNTVITVPDDCKGISIRLDVDNGTVCDNVQVSLELRTITEIDEQNIVANKQSKLLSIGSSFMTGIIYPTGTNMVYCSYDSTPYGNIAIGLGIEQKNVQHILMSSTGILAVNPSHPERGNILDKLTSMDLSPYDYILTEVNRPDLGTNTNGFPLGDLTSIAGDGSIVGAILSLLAYMKTSNPSATLILVGAPPSATQDSQAYENVFTYVYRDGSSIGDCDLMMHRLAVREHFIFIDWEDLNISYYYKDFCYPGNVHCMTEPPVRMMGQYLARNCNYGTSIAKVIRADANT